MGVVPAWLAVPLPHAGELLGFALAIAFSPLHLALMLLLLLGLGALGCWRPRAAVH